MRYTETSSPFGSLRIAAEDDGIRLVDFTAILDARVPTGWVRDDASLRPIVEQLRAYFAGTLRDFEVPLAPQGTPFQQRVWSRLLRIPYGTTVSYGELARSLGIPRATRAVAQANARNRIAILIPCHRVIGSNGALTGYAGGTPIKAGLLALERRQAGADLGPLLTQLHEADGSLRALGA